MISSLDNHIERGRTSRLRGTFNKEGGPLFEDLKSPRPQRTLRCLDSGWAQDVERVLPATVFRVIYSSALKFDDKHIRPAWGKGESKY